MAMASVIVGMVIAGLRLRMLGMIVVVAIMIGMIMAGMIVSVVHWAVFLAVVSHRAAPWIAVI
ncbi:hypothetical protein D3C87_2041550 [compost metagenome]